jgi:hypothetical protein
LGQAFATSIVLKTIGFANRDALSSTIKQLKYLTG